jgi:hypothetical protein
VAGPAWGSERPNARADRPRRANASHRSGPTGRAHPPTKQAFLPRSRILSRPWSLRPSSIGPFGRAPRASRHPPPGSAHRRASVQDVRVDHGRGDIAVPQQFLNRADVVPVLQKMGGEGVTERVWPDALSRGHPAALPPSPRAAEPTREDGGACARPWRLRRRFAWRGTPIAIATPVPRKGLPSDGIRQFHPPGAPGDVALVLSASPVEVSDET